MLNILDKSKQKLKVNTFVEACNLFEKDLGDLLALKKGQEGRYSNNRQEGIEKKERKLINRIKVTNKDVLQKVGEFLMQKGSVDKALYLHKLVENSKK